MSTFAGEREDYLSQFHADGFVRSTHTLTDADMVPLMTTFHELVDEIYESPTEHGKEILDAFATNVPGRELNAKGFIERRRIGEVSIYEIGRSPATEDKDLMHYTPQTREHVRAMLGCRMPKLVRTLLDQCEAAYQDMAESLRPVVAAFDIEDVIFAPRGREQDNIHLLRLLGYPGRPGAVEKGQAMTKAELHFDRGKFTSTGWDSRPGLVGTPSQNGFLHQDFTSSDLAAHARNALKNPIEHKAGQAIIFAGAGYNHLPYAVRQNFGAEDLPLFLHGFHDTQPELPRDTAVCFFNEQVGYQGIGSPEAYETGYGDVLTWLLARERMMYGEPANSN